MIIILFCRRPLQLVVSDYIIIRLTDGPPECLQQTVIRHASRMEVKNNSFIPQPRRI